MRHRGHESIYATPVGPLWYDISVHLLILLLNHGCILGCARYFITLLHIRFGPHLVFFILYILQVYVQQQLSLYVRQLSDEC